MFYSHDLLGRKTPLGAIWTLAHGRKLSKGKIISINLREICDEILQPGVPHSLRLQGILIGGVVLVFNKQQTYLLEDLQEMMRRVKAAGDLAPAGDALKGASAKGKGRGKQNNGNNQARLEAITLMDMEDLMAPAALAGDDIAGLLAGGSISEALASQGALPGNWGRLAAGGELAGDLFMMPSLAGGAASEGGDTDAQGNPVSKRSSKGTRTTGNTHHQEQELYGGADMMQQEWVNPEDEVFADPFELDLLGGMDLARPDAAATSDKSRDQTTSEQGKQAASDATAPTEGTAAAAAPGRMVVGGDGVPYEFDDQMFVMEDQEQPVGTGEPDVQQQPEGSDSLQGCDQEGQPVEQVKRAKQRKRKAGTVIMDDLDNLLIKNKVYREWCTDSSPLLNKDSSLHQAHTSAAAPLLLDTTAGLGFPGASSAAFAGGLQPLSGGVPMCSELLELFKAPAEAAAAARNTRAGKAKPEGPSSPEVNNSTGEGSLPGSLPDSHKLPLDLHQAPEDMMMQQDEDLNMMMAESPPHPNDQEMLSNDEAHDQLGDLPFNGDIEIERLRAANTPGSSDGSLRHMFPGGSTGVMKSRGSNATSAGGSSLLGARAAGNRDMDGSGLKRRLGSADLGTTEDLDLFFGTGNLADMLPDIDAEQFYDNVPQHEEGRASGDLDNAAADRRTGSIGPGSSRELTPYNSSQFPLLEETEPEATQQKLQEHAALSKMSQLALSIFNDRLQRAGEQLAAEGAANDAAGTGPSVSFFNLIREGNLSRNQAATLFYQVCVTSTAGFVSATQERAYGDIAIRHGSRAH